MTRARRLFHVVALFAPLLAGALPAAADDEGDASESVPDGLRDDDAAVGDTRDEMADMRAAMSSSSWAGATEAPDDDEGARAEAVGAASTMAATPSDSINDEMLELLDRLDELEDRLVRVEAENAALLAGDPGAPHITLGDGLKLRPRGFVDVGAFYAFGDGTAYVRDVDRRYFRSVGAFPMLLPIGPRAPPDDTGAAWVFFGDPWANTVNTQGDPAHLGRDRSVIHRFDPIAKTGGFSFIVNTVGVGMTGSLGQSLLFETLFLVEPRAGALGAPGDVFSVPLAFVDWRPFDALDLHLFVGKLTSTFGREYRQQFASDRFGITPSMLARYTSGNPIGGKVRWRIFDGLFTIASSLTNGGAYTERFGLFAEDVDSNTLPTGMTRISTEGELDFLNVRGEAGASALVGVMDGQADLTRLAHQVGVDLHLEVDDFTFDFEYMRGEAPRAVTGEGPFLTFDGFVFTSTLRATNVVGVIARVDARRALLLTAPNLYVSDVARFTIGLRFDLSYHLVLKVEAIRVQELSGPEISDDVLTSSMVLRF